MSLPKQYNVRSSSSPYNSSSWNVVRAATEDKTALIGIASATSNSLCERCSSHARRNHISDMRNPILREQLASATATRFCNKNFLLQQELVSAKETCVWDENLLLEWMSTSAKGAYLGGSTTSIKGVALEVCDRRATVRQCNVGVAFEWFWGGYWVLLEVGC